MEAAVSAQAGATLVRPVVQADPADDILGVEPKVDEREDSGPDLAAAYSTGDDLFGPCGSPELRATDVVLPRQCAHGRG